MKYQKILYVIIAMACLILFIGFTVIVKTDILNQLDFTFMVKLQNKTPHRLDLLLSVFSLIGNVEVLSVILIIILALHRKMISWLTLFIFWGAHLFELIGKAFLTHPGPPFMFHRTYTILSMPSNYVQPGSSYPSGHSLRSVFIIIVIIYILYMQKTFSRTYKLMVSLLLGGLLFLILLSRISLGEHWLTDVIGGSLLGAGAGFISLLFL